MQFKLTSPSASQHAQARNVTLKRLGRAVVRAVDQTGAAGQKQTRAAMVAARMGGLSKTIKYTSDQKKGRVPQIDGNTRTWRTGAVMWGPHNSERAVGAFAAYSSGLTTIVPRRGRWLAIATDEIPKKVGRYRMTPELYEANGFDRRIGPLHFLESKRHPNEAFLIVHDVQVNAARGFGNARRIPRHGRVGDGRKAVDFIVAFILIRVTARAERYSPKAIWIAECRKMNNRVVDNLRGPQPRNNFGPSIGSVSGSFTQ